MYSQSGYRVTESAGTSVMLRGKLNRAALHSAMSTLSSIIESVRRLAALTPSSDRESEPTSMMFTRPSAPGVQFARSGAGGHAFGLVLAPGELGAVGVVVSVASAEANAVSVAPTTAVADSRAAGDAVATATAVGVDGAIVRGANE